MLVRSGDREGGVAYAQAALAALPSEKHSLTLRMLMEEIKKPSGSGIFTQSARAATLRALLLP